MSSGAQDFETILRFMRRTAELSADELRPTRGGWLVKTPSLPSAWGLNHLRLSQPMSFAEVLAVADEELEYLPYRHVVLEDAGAQSELEQPFLEAGWKADRELLMVVSRTPDRGVDTSAVVEPDDEGLFELMRRWTLEAQPEVTPDTMRQLLDFGHREACARGDRGFAMLAPDRTPVAMTKLRTGGTVAQVEDVYTVPEAREQGLARALVTHAVAVARAAGHKLIFIMADDDDWPKQLYARIGFEPVGRILQFHKELSPSAGA